MSLWIVKYLDLNWSLIELRLPSITYNWINGFSWVTHIWHKKKDIRIRPPCFFSHWKIFFGRSPSWMDQQREKSSCTLRDFFQGPLLHQCLKVFRPKGWKPQRWVMDVRVFTGFQTPFQQSAFEYPQWKGKVAWLHQYFLLVCLFFLIKSERWTTLKTDPFTPI